MNDTHPKGVDLTYTITVTNSGVARATYVTMTDPIPAPLLSGTVSADSDQGTCVTAELGQVTCELGDLDPGTDAVVTIVLSGVGHPHEEFVPVTKTASALADGASPVRASAMTIIEPAPTPPLPAAERRPARDRAGRRHPMTQRETHRGGVTS